MGGAAVVALGAIRFASVAAVIKVYFLLQASCVFALSPLGGVRARSPAQGAEVGPSGSARAELACERGRGRGQVELPGSSALRDVMKGCRFCRFDAARGPWRLMRVGLALILVGHVNLLLGAVLHGTVLRHVANPSGAVTPEYTTANVISVGSGLLSVSVGLVALLASRNLLRPRLHWALLGLAVANLLLSTACSLGLLLAVSLTVANGGRLLIADCHPGLLNPLLPLDEGPGHTDCPFDPTRIYDTALALWIPSLLMSAAEAVLSGYCCVAALTLRGVGPCRKEGLQEQLEELTELEYPKHRRQDNEQLLNQDPETQTSQKNWA